jgi:predicted esterase
MYQVVLESKIHDKVLTLEQAERLKKYLESIFVDVKVEIRKLGDKNE